MDGTTLMEHIAYLKLQDGWEPDPKEAMLKAQLNIRERLMMLMPKPKEEKQDA